MNLFWSHNPAVPNFGDDINPFLFSKLLGMQVNHVPSNYQRLHYMGIGSVLHHANEFSTIVGTGFIQANDTFIQSPFRIIAVRGPQTRKDLLRLGVSCPEVYGDPALLFPRIYNPLQLKKYRLGIIPHFIDKDLAHLYKIAEANPDVKMLDIQDTNHLQFIRDVCSCELIASSTLHGIIIADAYGIPSAWLEFSDKVVGNGFKFRDYFSSVATEYKNPIRVKPDTTVQQIMDGFTDKEIEFDPHPLLEGIKKIHLWQ